MVLFQRQLASTSSSALFLHLVSTQLIIILIAGFLAMQPHTYGNVYRLQSEVAFCRAIVKVCVANEVAFVL